MAVERAETSATIARRSPRRRPSGAAPPLPRQLNVSGWGWLVLAVAVVVFLMVVLLSPRVESHLLVADHLLLYRLAELRTPWLTTVMRLLGSLATSEVLLVVWWAIVAVLVVWRRWRHLFVTLGALIVVQNFTLGASEMLQRPRPVGIEILGEWTGFAMPSRPVAIIATVSIIVLYALIPAGRPREWGKLAVALILAVTIVSRLYLAQDAPSDALVGMVFGVAIPLAAFRLLTPTSVYPVSYRRGRTAHLDLSGLRHDAIMRGLRDQLAVIPVEIKAFGLAGSGGSTPMRIRVKGDPDTYLFGKLYAKSHLRSDRWYKFGRTLMYGKLEDEKAFNSVRRLVQYEDYMLRLMRDADLPTQQPFGIVEITPEREYLLVTEFFDNATEIGDADVDQSIIDQGLRIVRQMWDAGLAHRDIKPANLLVREGTLLVIDSAFGEVRPSPWRQAVDLGNMMLVLALRTDAKRVFDRAVIIFSEDEIAEAFAATRGLTMPTQLRSMIKKQGNDLHADFCTLLPTPVHPIRIQRWSVRRVMLIAWVLFATLLAVGLAFANLESPL
jgi:hypothetical protein